MKSLRVLAAALIALLVSSAGNAATKSSAPKPSSVASPSFEGGWEGEAETERWPLFMTIRLQRDGASYSGNLAVLGQTVPLPILRIEGATFTFASSSETDALVLRGTRGSNTLKGRLRQGAADYPFVLYRIPNYPKPANRIEGWRQDLDALEQRFARFDRSFTPASHAAFSEAIAAIREQLPSLDDAQVTMRIASAIALANNAHTRLYLLRNRTELRRLPIRLWWFNDGLRVVRATREHEALLGCRVDAIAGLDPRQVRDIVAPAFAGNAQWRDYMSVYSLTSPEALHGLGVTPTAENVAFTFSDCAAATPSLSIESMPLVKSTAALEAWWDLSPAHTTSDPAWLQSLAVMHRDVPLYLRNADQYYWFDYLPQSGIFYFNYNRDADMQNEDTAAFAKRLLAAFDTARPTAFVLDLRFNTGGNGELAQSLMQQLREKTKGMPRFVITGRATFSAGISHAAAWRAAGAVAFVGEPVGDRMDFWSEGGNIILPSSGLAAHFGNGAHSYSTAPCPKGVKCLDMSAPSLDPDVPTLLSWRDYESGRDPAMNAIVNALQTNRR